MFLSGKGGGKFETYLFHRLSALDFIVFGNNGASMSSESWEGS